MTYSTHHWILVAFNLGYLIAVSPFFYAARNFEFMWYLAAMVFLFALIALTLKTTRFSTPLLWALSLWGLLHVLGGGVVIDGKVLYAMVLLPLFTVMENPVLKYDQLVHFYGFAVATLVVYELIRPHLAVTLRRGRIYFVLVAAGTGLGVFNEIVEFIAVVVFTNTGVGGYANTLVDLIANTLGALCAVIFIHAMARFRGPVSASLAPAEPAHGS